MQDVPDAVLEAARWAAAFSTMPEPEWSAESHDVTESVSLDLGLEYKYGQSAAHADLWEEALGELEGSTRDWFDGLRNALNELAQALDASGLARRH